MEERSDTVPAHQTRLRPSSLPYTALKVHANKRKYMQRVLPTWPLPGTRKVGRSACQSRPPGVSYRGRDETRLRGALLEGPRAGEPPRRPAPRGNRAMLLPSPGRCCRWPAPRGPSSESRSVGRHPGAARGVSGSAPGTRGQHSCVPAAVSCGGPAGSQGGALGTPPPAPAPPPDTWARGGAMCSRRPEKATTLSMTGCSRSWVSQALVHRSLKSGWGQSGGQSAES